MRLPYRGTGMNRSFLTTERLLRRDFGLYKVWLRRDCGLYKDHNLCEEYENAIEEYVKKGYAIEVSRGELTTSFKGSQDRDGRIWYLPPHTVFYARKRINYVLYFMYAKFKNTSLNDQLLQGPDVNNTLLGVLLP